MNRDTKHRLGAVSDWEETADTAARARLAEIEREMDSSAAVQSWFLPPAPSFTAEGFHVSALYRPADKCSGDWWWHELQPDGKLAVFVGDVMGHGHAAAFLTAVLATNLRRWREHGGLSGIPAKLEALSNEIRQLSQGNYLVTMTVLELDPRSRHAVVHSAGGQPVVVVPHDAPARVLLRASSPLGSAKFELGRMEYDIAPGDRLVMLTDGLIESRTSTGRELGLKRLVRVLSDTRAVPIEEAAQQAVNRISEERGPAEQQDDITVVLIEPRLDVVQAVSAAQSAAPAPLPPLPVPAAARREGARPATPLPVGAAVAASTAGEAALPLPLTEDDLISWESLPSDDAEPLELLRIPAATPVGTAVDALRVAQGTVRPGGSFESEDTRPRLPLAAPVPERHRPTPPPLRPAQQFPAVSYPTASSEFRRRRSIPSTPGAFAIGDHLLQANADRRPGILVGVLLATLGGIGLLWYTGQWQAIESSLRASLRDDAPAPRPPIARRAAAGPASAKPGAAPAAARPVPAAPAGTAPVAPAGVAAVNEAVPAAPTATPTGTGPAGTSEGTGGAPAPTAGGAAAAAAGGAPAPAEERGTLVPGLPSTAQWPLVDAAKMTRISGRPPVLPAGMDPGADSAQVRVCVGRGGWVLGARVESEHPDAVRSIIEAALLRWHYEPHRRTDGSKGPACMLLQIPLQRRR